MNFRWWLAAGLVVVGLLWLLWPAQQPVPSPTPQGVERVGLTPEPAPESPSPTESEPATTESPSEPSVAASPVPEPQSDLGIVSGRVVDPQRKPVPNMSVQLRRAYPHGDTPWGPWHETGTYTYHRALPAVATDAEGEFEILGVETAPYSIEVKGDGYAQVETGFFFLEPKEHRSNIEIVVGDGGSIAGVVVDVFDRPIADAYVTVQELPLRYPRTVARSDSAGAFAARGLPNAQHEVTVWADGYTIALRADIPVGEQAARIVLESTGTLRLSVLDKYSGDPVTDYHVKLSLDTEAERRRRSLSSFIDMSRGEHVTTPNGVWEKADLQYGPYILVVQAFGYRPYRDTQLYIAPADAPAGTVGIRDLKIALDSGNRVRGIVVDEWNRPIAGASVSTARSFGSLVAVDSDLGTGPQSEATTTDAYGEFVLGGLAASAPTITVTCEGFRSQEVTLPEGVIDANLGSIQLVRGESVSGYVSVPEGVSIRRGRVTLALGLLRFAAEVDEDGYYEIAGLSPGTYQLKCTVYPTPRGKKLVVTETVVVEAGDALRRDLALE